MMLSRKAWLTIFAVLLLIQVGGITLYFLRKQPGAVVQMLTKDSEPFSVRVFRQNGLHVTTSPPHQSINSLSGSKVIGHQSINSPSAVNRSKVVNRPINITVDRPELQLRVNELLKRIATRQLTHPMPLLNSSGKLWDKSTFCHKFLIDTFPKVVKVCSAEEGVAKEESIVCHGNDLDPAHMSTCTLRNVAVQPDLLYNSVEAKFDKEGTLFLINDKDTSCAKPTVDFISKKLERDDYQLKMLTKIVKSDPKPSSSCDVWVNKTAIFFTNQKYHIYFRLIEYYTVHKALWDLGVNEGDYVVVRISTNEDMMFPEFDDALFPGAINLRDFPQNATVCFRKVITIPRCFASIPFRSKMNSRIRNQCFECNGRGLTASPFYTFRERALKACNLTDVEPKNPHGTIVVISRKPYVRYPSDEFKRFQRVLSNEDDLVNQLKKKFPSAGVSVIHLEALPICEQIRYAHSADALVGVHGAGLVHFWWIKENSIAIELEPSFEVGNPSFRMLTTLTGRRYKSIRISGHMSSVTVKSADVVGAILDSKVIENT